MLALNDSSSKKSTSTTDSSSLLAPLLRHFVGIDIIVETKQGRKFKGRLMEADAYMNLILSRNNTVLTSTGETTDEDGVDDEETFNWIHIRGPTIRYIIFGANVDIPGVIRAGRDRERSAGDRYKRGVRKAPKTTTTTIS
jgi:small nuclear ribonucleoprotein (snRNP)-like protein